MKDLFPIVSDLKSYTSKKFQGDMTAGITIGVMLIPQGMAYALIAGLPPVYGLYAAIFPQLIYAILGTSRQLAVGPVAMDSIIVATGVSALAVANTSDYIAMAILLALMMGAIQLLMGVLRLGFVVNFLSRPVVNGFTYAAALVISINQLKHLTGVDLKQDSFTFNIVLDLIRQFAQVNQVSVTIGLVSILVIVLLKFWNRHIPAAIVVVILSTVLVYVGNFQEIGVKIVGDIPKGFPGFGMPQISAERLTDLLPIAATLALIGFMEAYSVAKAIQQNHQDEYKVDANRELIALGSGNIFGSLFSSFPTSGGFSRSAVNEEAGGKTSVASIISALLVLMALMFFTPLFYYLPKTVLAAIIITAVIGLIDFSQILKLWNTDRSDFFMLLSTFLGTLFIGIKEGILFGVGLSMVMMIFRTTRPHMAVLGKIPGTSLFKNVNRFEEADEVEGALIVRFDSRLYFANVNYFQERIEELIQAKGNKLKLLVIDAQSIPNIDSTGMQAFHDLLDYCDKNTIILSFAHVIGPVRDTFVKAGFVELLGKDHCFERIDQAILAFLAPDQKENTEQLGFQYNS
ncbi:MAG: solute carrier family 26 protein [Cyclobacteriaceae bacterium]